MTNAPVLIVDNCLSSVTGVRAVAEDLALHLEKRGWTVMITSTKRTRPGRFLDMILSTWKCRRKYKIANVVVYSGLAFLWAETVCFLLRRLGKPYVLTLQGGNLPDFARRWPRRVRRLLISAVEVTTPSAYLCDRLSHLREKMLVVPNPINIGNYPFQHRDKAAPKIVWIRAFHHIYNPSLAPRALSLLKKEFPDIQLTMIGPDKGDGSLQLTRQTIQELNLAGHVTMTGAIRKADIPNQLNRGDIFLNTTNIDNTPVTVLEAMACGLCVVSTNVGGLLYLLDHPHNALLVEPDDPQAMASAIKWLLTDSELASSLSRNAGKMTEQLDWSIVITEWEDILKNVARHA